LLKKWLEKWLFRAKNPLEKWLMPTHLAGRSKNNWERERETKK
jgi:hypothetical protein